VTGTHYKLLIVFKHLLIEHLMLVLEILVYGKDAIVALLTVLYYTGRKFELQNNLSRVYFEYPFRVNTFFS